MAEIWKNLKQLRAARNLTQEDVASKIGLTRQAISSYESGRNYLLSVLLISAIMLVLSYLLLPDSYAVNVFVTLRFSWYILLATCLIVIVIQWGKRKVKQLKSK